MSNATKKFPTYTIITVTLNNRDGLLATQKSVEEQTFSDYEWIVIDGGSTDGSIDILREKRSATRTADFPFQFTSESDHGIYDAMNKGMAKARGRYLIFLNGGDQFTSKDTLQNFSKPLKDKPDFIYGDSLEPVGTEKPRYKTARNHKDIQWGLFTHHQAMFYRRNVARDNGLHYSLLYKIASDYDFTARFLRHCKTIKHIPKPLCIFEQGGISQQQASKARREQFEIREKLEICGTATNLFIFMTQYSTWLLRKICPPLYYLLKK